MKLKKLLNKKVLIIVSVLFILFELFARYYLGLGESFVYVEHSEYEYFPAPDQDVRRFGNTIRTNKHGMRSETPDSGKRKILKIGDSVINGGPHVSNDELASTLIEDTLNSDTDEFQVLNISAGSWGPDNAFAYISEHGHYDCEMMVLVFSSHDFHDNMHHRKVVGVHPAWPAHQPLCAISDLMDNYALPRIKSVLGENEYDYLHGFDDSAINSGWKNLSNYASQHQIPMILYLHPEKQELQAGNFNAEGQQLITFLNENNIPFISGIEKGMKPEHYRDHIHLNRAGQKQLFLNLITDIGAGLNE